MKKSLLAGAALFMLLTSLGAFELQTRIFPADTKVKLCITAASPWAKDWITTAAEMQKAGKAKFKKGLEYPLLGYFREDRRHSDSDKYQTKGYPEPLDFQIDGNKVLLEVDLRGASIHSIIFIKFPVPRRRFKNFRVVKLMTLDKETFKLRPFKGNVHQHSTASDGRFEPEEHVAYARIAGFDFLGVSDHSEYRQNPVVIKTAADSRSGLEVYPAEELHTPSGIMHGLSIGATRAHSYRKRRTPEWLNELQPILDEIKKKYPATDPDQLLPWAESLLLARRAKADGALVVYCHPAWRLRYFLNNSSEMADFIMRSKEYEVIEIINSSMRNHSRAENMETIAQYTEICTETGIWKPVMSSSDSHNVSSESYRRCYNVIFAPDCTFPSFKAAFLEGRAVASFELNDDPKQSKPQPIHFGRLKYVRYANFLDDIGYWKKHDRWARKQGELIMKYLKGDKSVVQKIADLNKTMIKYRENLYHNPGK